MRLESLSLRGVLRFDEPVTLNLRDLPEGLIAICGANGEGKTTLIESPIAALYRSFPSRSDRELFDYATSRDSYLEAIFAIEGRGSYRARVNLDGVKRIADAVLEQRLPDGTAAPLNDGKVSTYDAAIARVFPAREVLLASAVAAQNRVGSFVSLDRKGRKDLFSRLLGLEAFEQMAQTARQAAGACETTRGALQAQREILGRQAAPELGEALEEEGAQFDLELRQRRQDREQLGGFLQEAESAQARCQAQARQHAEARAKLAAAQEIELVARQALAGAERERAAAERAQQAEALSIGRAREERLASIAERIRNNEGLIAQAAAIRGAVAKKAALLAELEALRTEEAALREEEHQAGAALHELGGRRNAAADAGRELERARRQAATLQQVPCGGEGAFSGCAFLTEAQQAKARIPELEARAGELPAIEQQIALAAAAAEARGRRLAESARRDAAHRDALNSCEPLAKLLGNLEAAESRIAELEADRASAEKEHAERLAASLKALEERLLQLSQQAARASEEALRKKAEAEAAQALIDATADAAAELRQAEMRLGDLRARWDDSTRELARLEAAIAAWGDRLARHQDACIELEDLDRRLRLVGDELLEWQLLAKAFGRDGLPVLEIDAAGPTVSAYCNDLLAVCFGPRFTVELVTQEAKASGKGLKESFDLKVFDNLRGGDARDLGDLSGGEQILVDEALKNALALFVNSRHAGAIQTCWRDETTGPLDADNAAKYLEMLRRVQAIGGFRHILFVTHNAAAAAAADAQIRVGGGRAAIALPPFREAA
jgi:exonuclease SbcC